MKARSFFRKNLTVQIWRGVTDNDGIKAWSGQCPNRLAAEEAGLENVAVSGHVS